MSLIGINTQQVIQSPVWPAMESCNADAQGRLRCLPRTPHWFAPSSEEGKPESLALQKAGLGICLALLSWSRLLRKGM